jgi:hypothetical protein
MSTRYVGTFTLVSIADPSSWICQSAPAAGRQATPLDGDGAVVGELVGEGVGAVVGAVVGEGVGAVVGAVVGDGVGAVVGAVVGDGDGAGELVPVTVNECVTVCPPAVTVRGTVAAA